MLPNTTVESYPNNHQLTINEVFAILMLPVILIGILGNTVSIYVYSRKHMKKSTVSLSLQELWSRLYSRWDSCFSVSPSSISSYFSPLSQLSHSTNFPFCECQHVPNLIHSYPVPGIWRLDLYTLFSVLSPLFTFTQSDVLPKWQASTSLSW